MRFRSILFTLLLCGCVASPPPPPLAPMRASVPISAAPLPPPPRSTDWRDWPRSPGTWSYARDDRGSIALFGTIGSDAVLTLRCDRAAGRVYLSRAGTDTAPFTVRTSSVTRVLPVKLTGGAAPHVAVDLAASDPLLDAIGFSRGRFVVEQSGQPIVAPAWAEVERVIEDCRG